MKFFVYILQSQKDKKFYIGSTSDLEKRLVYHNRGANRSTRHRRPCTLIYFEEFDEKTFAMKREYFLKSPKGFLEKKKIIKNILHSGVAQR
jgi:putative endonuclease